MNLNHFTMMKNTLDMEYNPHLTSVQVVIYDVFFLDASKELLLF